MGKVYEAEERLTQRKVALKVLRPELAKSEDGRRLFLNEMQILAHLEHANIVRSLASMEHEGQLVMVLEFLEGRTLREELVSRGKLPWQEAVEVVVRMAEALVVAHGQEPPIIHRDLKPENVMLTADGGLKVMDFGIAKVLEAAHATNTQSIGTLQYMSPEQIDAQTIDTRSDLYSLGLIFFEALAGEPPFRSASPRELLNMQCSSAAPELTEDVRRGLPRGVEAVLFELLEKAPGDRPADAADVVARLAPFRSSIDASAARGTGSGRKTASGKAPEGTATPARGEVLRSSAGPVRGDTRHSGDTPAPSPKAGPGSKSVRLDTIALVEKAAEPRQVPTSVAVLAIVLLSIAAGLATYAIRMRASAPAEAPGAATASVEARDPAQRGR
jgi:serine/threonine-protein kinase